MSKHHLTSHLPEADSSLREEPEYTVYTVRLPEDSPAIKGLTRLKKRFGQRYEAGTAATILHEFFLLLDGSDPHESLLYPLLHPILKQLAETQVFPPVTNQAQVASTESSAPTNARQEEEEEGISLQSMEAMQANLSSFFDHQQ